MQVSNVQIQVPSQLQTLERETSALRKQLSSTQQQLEAQKRSSQQQALELERQVAALQADSKVTIYQAGLLLSHGLLLL